MKITESLKEKIEEILKTLGYKIRFEKGNFRSGVCIIENQNVIVINKFFPLEARVNSLIEILGSLNGDLSLLSDKQQKLLIQLRQANPLSD